VAGPVADSTVRVEASTHFGGNRVYQELTVFSSRTNDAGQRYAKGFSRTHRAQRIYSLGEAKFQIATRHAEGLWPS
jgi:hypothetical protein